MKKISIIFKVGKKMEKITIITSIAPYDIDNQKKAIQTWIDSGFDVISFNCKEEIEVLAESFSEIVFCEAIRTAEDVVGKKCPYIYDMIQALKKYDNTRYGIVNSDIYFQNMDETIYNRIWHETENQIVYCRRNEINHLLDVDKYEFHMESRGIDAFFFDKKWLDYFEDDGLIIGNPVWDHWFFFTAFVKKIGIRELLNPVTFHISHAIRWNRVLAEQLSSYLVQKYLPGEISENNMFYVAKIFYDISSAFDIGIFESNNNYRDLKIAVVYAGENQEVIYRLKNQTLKNLELFSNVDKMVNPEAFDYIVYLNDNFYFNNVALEFYIDYLEKSQRKITSIYGYPMENLKYIHWTLNENVLEVYNQCIAGSFIASGTSFEKALKLKQIDNLVKSCVVGIEMDYKIYAEQELKLREIEGKLLMAPAGILTSSWIKKFGLKSFHYEVVGIFDNDIDKRGAYLQNVKIFGKDDLKNLDFDKIVITSPQYSEALYEQFKALGLEKKIVVL